MSLSEKNNEIIIKPMDVSCIPELVGIEKACFSKPWTYDGFLAELKNDTAKFYTAVCEDKTVGYMGIYIVCGEGYVANVAVLPEYRRRGIAGGLIRNAINICKENNADFLSLEVRVSNNAAIALYEKYGFKKAGERKNFYSSPTENAYIMTLDFTEDNR